MSNKENFDRYARLRSIMPMDSIRNAFAIVGGIGALGNEVAKNLALLGVGHVLICDFDSVEIHNLTRSILFRACDTGRKKAEVAAERIREINPEINAFAFSRNVAELGLGFYRRSQMIFTTFDALYPRFVINEACMCTGRPWVDAGMSSLTHGRGLVAAFNASDPEAPCYACSMPPDQVIQDLNRVRGVWGCNAMEQRIESAGGVPSSPMTSSVIGATQVAAALDIMKTSAEDEVGSDWFKGAFEINLHTKSSRIRKAKRFPGCYFHDMLGIRKIQNIVEVPEWNSAETTPAQILKRARKDLGMDRVFIQMPERMIGAGKCGSCGANWGLFLPVSSSRILQKELKCPQCGSNAFLASGELSTFSELGEDFQLLDKPIKSLGFRPLDIIRVVTDDKPGTAGDSVQYEITGDAKIFGLEALSVLE